MQNSAKNKQGQVVLCLTVILNSSEKYMRFTILGYSETCPQNFIKIEELCFWTTLHGFNGYTLLRSFNFCYRFKFRSFLNSLLQLTPTSFPGSQTLRITKFFVHRNLIRRSRVEDLNGIKHFL